MSTETTTFKTPAGDIEIPKGPLLGLDQSPMPPEQRTWGMRTSILSGIGMGIALPIFLINALAITLGLNFQQALGFSALGSGIMGLLWVLNGHFGLKFSLPYTVQLRSVFGYGVGTHIITVLRSIFALIFYGICSWFCAMATDQILSFVSTGWVGWLTPWGRLFVLFLIYTGVQYLIVYKGYTPTKWIMTVGSPAMVIIMAIAIGWIYQVQGTLGPVFTDPQYTAGGSVAQCGAFLAMVMGAICAMWVNMSDITRVVKDRKPAFIGFSVGLAIGYVVSAAFAITAGSVNMLLGYGYEWNIILWMGHYPVMWFAVLMLVLVVLATLTTNPLWNLFACATTVCNFSPRKISWRKSCGIVSLVSLLTFPWFFLSGAGAVYYNLLVTFGGILGPVAAIMMLDWWWIRKQKVHLADYYKDGGIFHYWKGGINWFAIIAVVVALGSIQINPGYAPFIATPVGAGVFALLIKFVGPRSAVIRRASTATGPVV